MKDYRNKTRNQNWSVDRSETGTVCNGDAQLAVLMDIRDELQKLNQLLHCSNFVAIPTVLREIRKNTKRKKRPAAPKLKAVG